MLCCHVDDFCWGGTKLFEDKVINVLRQKFRVSKEENSAFTFLGLNVFQSSDGILLHQQEYIDELLPIEIEKNRGKNKKTKIVVRRGSAAKKCSGSTQLGS